MFRYTNPIGNQVISQMNVSCVHRMHAIGAIMLRRMLARLLSDNMLAIECYEWNNQVQKFKSIILMVQFSWRLACETKISNPQMFHLIKNCLKQIMVYNYLILEFFKDKGVKIQYNQLKKEKTHYCKVCSSFLIYHAIYYIT